MYKGAAVRMQSPSVAGDWVTRQEGGWATGLAKQAGVECEGLECPYRQLFFKSHITLEVVIHPEQRPLPPQREGPFSQSPLWDCVSV